MDIVGAVEDHEAAHHDKEEKCEVDFCTLIIAIAAVTSFLEASPFRIGLSWSHFSQLSQPEHEHCGDEEGRGELSQRVCQETWTVDVRHVQRVVEKEE